MQKNNDWIGADNIKLKLQLQLQLQVVQCEQAESSLQHYQNHLETLVEARTQELEGSNRELESDNYSIAHDLRAPLRSITNFSQILSMAELVDVLGCKMDNDGSGSKPETVFFVKDNG